MDDAKRSKHKRQVANGREARERRQEGADARRVERDKRTNAEQLARLVSKNYGHTREAARLTKKVEGK